MMAAMWCLPVLAASAAVASLTACGAPRGGGGDPAPGPAPLALAGGPGSLVAPAPAQLAAGGPDAAPAVDAAAAVVAESVPSLPAPPLPAALAAAPAWVHRRLSTGLVPGQHRLATYRLHRAGRAAALVWEEQTSDAPGQQRDLGPWTAPALVEQFVGTITPERGGVRLTLRAVDPRGPDHGYEQRWTCRTGRTQVAAAGAVRVPAVAPDDRAEGAECDGDPGRWVPARTRAVATLTCDPIDQPEDGIQLVFAAGAGVEHLDVNDDCTMQGTGLRLASPAGVVAPVRP